MASDKTRMELAVSYITTLKHLDEFEWALRKRGLMTAEAHAAIWNRQDELLK